jgi:hypothetical protein
MATKDELLTFGQAHGVDVDSSMLKADIEAALSDAGYDPTTLGEATVGTEEPRDEQSDVNPTTDEQSDVNPTTTPEDLEGTSSDAEHSTYSRPDQQREGEINPPPGPQTVQTRGKPEEASE